MGEKQEVRSGSEAEELTLPKSEQPRTKKKKGKSFKDNTIHDSETAKERGRNGGVRSGEVRREKRDARAAIQYIMSRTARSEAIRSNMKELGAEEAVFSNMVALQTRMLALALAGDKEAYELLMRYGGWDSEETRKERESLAADRRRELELEAKIKALSSKGSEDPALSLNLSDEDGNNDVVIYMPQMMTEEECQAADNELQKEASATAE